MASKRVICDIEGNGLNPTRVWVIVCKDIDTGELHVFREPDRSPEFIEFSRGVSYWVGHYFLSYDLPVLQRLIPEAQIRPENVIDTLVVSRLLDFKRSGGHGLAAWGDFFQRPKPPIAEEQWEVFSEDLVHRCTEDVEINFLLYNHFKEFIHSPRWAAALKLEHWLAGNCLRMSKNGFFFLLKEAKELRNTISLSLSPLEEELKEGFPKVLKVHKVVTPKETKFGTLSRAQFKFLGPTPDLSEYNGGSFSLLKWQEFDPGSTSQRIERLWAAGWKPYNKTKTHKEALKELRSYRRKTPPQKLLDRIARFEVYGWVCDEENLATLPETAPEAARKLVQWLQLSNRTSTLTTWINACVPSAEPMEGYLLGEVGRIHGSFNGIGSWTQRMSHDKPNVGNIPSFNAKQPHRTPYSDRMRALWASSPGRYLVGVDAESIQLRIFGHYINDQEFINALVAGRKEDSTDPHSLNQHALGSVCRSRDAAKTFIYAWLLGAGIAKVATILECTRDEAEVAIAAFIERYPGLVYLREQIIPEDAARGWFEGFDGRCVKIRGEDVGSRSHFALGGYLQNGEKIIMARANRLWVERCDLIRLPYWQVNFVHDEYQTETIRDWDVAVELGNIQADSIRQVGEDLGLRCPMAGSVLNSHGKIAIADNWSLTH